MLHRADPDVTVLRDARRDDQSASCEHPPRRAPANAGQHEPHEDWNRADHDKVRAEGEARRGHRKVEPAIAPIGIPAEQCQQRPRHERAGLRVDLGENRVRPERPAQAEAERGAHRDPARDLEAPRREIDECSGRGSPERREQVDPVRQGAQRQLREGEARQHVKRIPRIVGRPQGRADVLELRRVLRATQAGQERSQVDGEQGDEDRA